MACFSSYPRGLWTPPLPRNYHYLKIIFPSKSRVLTKCGHRQHHELGEYETTHSLYTFLSISFLSLFHYRFCLSLFIHSRVYFFLFELQRIFKRTPSDSELIVHLNDKWQVSIVSRKSKWKETSTIFYLSCVQKRKSPFLVI